MMNSNLCQHGIVFNLWLSQRGAVVSNDNQFPCREFNNINKSSLQTTTKVLTKANIHINLKQITSSLEIKLVSKLGKRLQGTLTLSNAFVTIIQATCFFNTFSVVEGNFSCWSYLISRVHYPYEMQCTIFHQFWIWDKRIKTMPPTPQNKREWQSVEKRYLWSS